MRVITMGSLFELKGRHLKGGSPQQPYRYILFMEIAAHGFPFQW